MNAFADRRRWTSAAHLGAHSCAEFAILLVAVGASLAWPLRPLAQWVSFQKETSARLVASPALVVNGNVEKVFAVADLNKDGCGDWSSGGSSPDRCRADSATTS